MTPQLARLALCGFACLAAGVASNALYFQQRAGARVTIEGTSRPSGTRGVEPAMWSPSKPAGKSADRRLGPYEANAIKLENPPEPGASDGRPETIRAVQRELKRRGYGPLEIDGTANLATRAAIMAFETDEGLPMQGIANELLLKQILLGASADAAPASKEPGPRAQEVVRIIQNWLLALGFQPGPSDGILTSRTQDAIRAFETSLDLPARGRISADLVKRLADTVPLKSAAR